MNKLDELTLRAKKNAEQRREIYREIKDYFQGKRIKIKDKFFNGQPHGSSKPSLYGKIFTTEQYEVSIGWGGRIIFFIKRDSISLDKVEVL